MKTLLNKALLVLLALIYWGATQLVLNPFRQNNVYFFIFLDVGQGDSMLIKSPDGATLLMDLGPDISALAEAGKYLDKRRLDYLFISHGDADHIGGIYDLNERYEIGAIVGSKGLLDQRPFSSLRLAKVPESFGCCLKILPLSHSIKAGDSNSDSQAYLIQFGDFKLLSAGDLPAQQELEIAKQAGDVSIVKIGHHGSKTSTSGEFLDTVRPQLAIISVGKDNKYGHPHPETLNLLAAKKINYLRTDISGTVIIKSDGKSWSRLSEPGFLW